MFWEYFWQSQNRGISRIPKASQYFDSRMWTKNAKVFVEVSIESSVSRAFDRALNEGASYFSSEVILVLVIRKYYFPGRQISKMSQLAAFPRRLLKMKSGYAPPKSRFKNSWTIRQNFYKKYFFAFWHNQQKAAILRFSKIIWCILKPVTIDLRLGFRDFNCLVK